MAKKAKEPNKLVEAKQNIKVTDTFLDILDIVAMITNTNDDIPEQLEYEIDISQLTGMFNLSHDRNLYRKMKIEAAKNVLKSPYNEFLVDNSKKTAPSFYFSSSNREQWKTTRI